jgi:hypothetical protein
MTRCVLLALAATSILAACTDASSEADAPPGVPRCSDLADTSFDADLAGTGCVTADGAALQGYRFECLDSSNPPMPGASVDRDSQVMLIPDAGLVGISGGPWQELGELAAFHRTPYNMLLGTECRWLRSIPSDWPIRVTCDLDGVGIDFVSLQGCERDGVYYAAVGRSCTYQDGDQTSFWEQWWLEPPVGDAPAAGVETAGPPETWTLIDSEHRDERCGVPPSDWPADWRAS